MPLSPPEDRDHIHHRSVNCKGYRRRDGLWDIEGHLTDVKTYGFQSDHRGEVEPGDPIHEMWIRLTVTDELEVVAVEAVTDHGPYTICGNITPNFQRLVGLRIKSGWTQKVKERLGGVHGCTHLVELLGPVATTAFQTIYPLRAREAEEAGIKPDTSKKPLLLNSCHAFATNSPIVKEKWPDWYKSDRSRVDA